MFSLKADRRVLIIFCLGVVAMVMISWLESSGSWPISPSVLREYRGFERRYPGYGGVVTAFQYLYYALESVMVLLMMAFFQRAGEIWTRTARAPWGGIGLALTWGAAHVGSHPEGAYVVVLSALLFGVVFVGVRKSFAPALAFVYLAFVL